MSFGKKHIAVNKRKIEKIGGIKMELKEFHNTMMYDEFGNKGLANNYYLLFGLVLLYMIFMILGSIGWLIYFR